MFSHILIPIDGSPLSMRAMETGLAFARDAGAHVSVLTVIEPFHVFTVRPDQLERNRADYERAVPVFVDEHLALAAQEAKNVGVRCETVQVTGDEPYLVIIDTASERSCDLIAMASHGRRGVAALLLGSVTQKVLTHSKIPVLVYR